jgi:hypothetical protein
MSDYFGYGMNNFNLNRCFAILKKGENYVAVPDQFNNLFVGGYSELCHDFQLQGFILHATIWAVDTKSAIEQSKAYDATEISRLNKELNELKKEISRLKELSVSSQSFNNLDPYVVLGFETGTRPSVEEVNTRKKKLALALHPDRGGSNFLMGLINSACRKLNV